ncbi:MAG: hypothetical protein J6P60_03235 [Lachnospiraceae bacterium]|nr:hypothetical protein [Lachnospiraceae bacterium]
MIRDEIKEQQKKLGEKSRKEKLQYFWYYYKIHVIVGIAVIFALFHLIPAMIQGNRENSIYVALINSLVYDDTETTLVSDYVASRDIDTQAFPPRLDYAMRIKNPPTDSFSVAYTQQFTAEMELGNIDVIISDQDMIDRYASMNAYADLTEALPKDLLDSLSDRLYYANVEGVGRIPVALYAKDVRRIKEDTLFDDSVTPMVAVAYNSHRIETAADFVHYLYFE